MNFHDFEGLDVNMIITCGLYGDRWKSLQNVRSLWFREIDLMSVNIEAYKPSISFLLFLSCFGMSVLPINFGDLSGAKAFLVS